MPVSPADCLQMLETVLPVSSVQGEEEVGLLLHFDEGILLSSVFLPQSFLQGSMIQPSVIKMPILFPQFLSTKASSDINKKEKVILLVLIS